MNANIAMVSAFSLHHDPVEAVRRGQEGFEFFGFALQTLVASDNVPGRSNLWGRFQASREDRVADDAQAPGIGTPKDFIGHTKSFQESGIDQVILMQQAGKNSHQNICDSLQLFADEVLPEFVVDRDARERAKAEELAPYVEAALARKPRMPELADDEIPVVYASVAKAQVNEGSAN